MVNMVKTWLGLEQATIELVHIYEIERNWIYS